jgi:ubiquitin-protein ligase
MSFPGKYPNVPPKIKFTTRVIHPLVTYHSGELDLYPVFKGLKAMEHNIALRCLFYMKSIFFTENEECIIDECVDHSVKQAMNQTRVTGKRQIKYF